MSGCYLQHLLTEVMTMNKNQQKMKATLEALNIMIQHASEGPSGFWTEDHEGCGNPKIFPEFEVGLTKGTKRTSDLSLEHKYFIWTS